MGGAGSIECFFSTCDMPPLHRGNCPRGTLADTSLLDSHHICGGGDLAGWSLWGERGGEFDSILPAWQRGQVAGLRCHCRLHSALAQTGWVSLLPAGPLGYTPCTPPSTCLRVTSPHSLNVDMSTCQHPRGSLCPGDSFIKRPCEGGTIIPILHRKKLRLRV